MVRRAERLLGGLVSTSMGNVSTPFVLNQPPSNPPSERVQTRSFMDVVEPMNAIPFRMRGSVGLGALCDLLPPPAGASLPSGEVLLDALCDLLCLDALCDLLPPPAGASLPSGEVLLDALCDLLCLDALCDLLPPPVGASLPSGEVLLAVSVSALCDFGFGVLGDPRLLFLEGPVELVLKARFIVVVCVMCVVCVVCVVCGVVGKVSAVGK
jgi:hypothetical protein